MLTFGASQFPQVLPSPVISLGAVSTLVPDGGVIVSETAAALDAYVISRVTYSVVLRRFWPWSSPAVSQLLIP
jgi:hypothetical protein